MKSSSLLQVSSSSKQIQTWLNPIKHLHCQSFNAFFFATLKAKKFSNVCCRISWASTGSPEFCLCQTRTIHIHTHKLSAFLVSFWKHVQLIFKCSRFGSYTQGCTVCYDMLISKLHGAVHGSFICFQAATPERSRCPHQWVHCFPRVAAAMLVRRCWDGTSSQAVSTQRGSASVRFAKSSLFGGHNTLEEMV